MQRLFILSVVALMYGSAVRAELPTKPVLTLEVALQIADAAKEEALKRGSTVVIVVVDEGG